MRKWKRLAAIGALLTALLILLFWSGILGGETLALLGALAAGGAKLISARKKTDKRLEETKKTIENVKDFSKRTDEEVKKIHEKVADTPDDVLVDRVNERERRRGSTTLR